MASLAFLVLGWRALGLTIESDAPDAHCPPVTEVREAVAARVGDVQGAAYEVRYGLVRDAQTGNSFVTLVVRDSEDAELLRREIPLSEGSCSDVALAIAVILERYFAGVIRPHGVESSSSASESPASEEPEPMPQGPAPSEDPETTTLAPAEIEPQEPEPQRDLSVRGAVGIGPGPQPTFHLAVGWRWTRSATVFSELTLWPLMTAASDPSFAERSAWTGVHVGVELSAPFGRALEFGAAPSVGIALEQATVSDPTVTAAGTRSRFVGTLGAQLRMGFALEERSSIGLLLHGTALVGGKRFVVYDNGASREVLDLPAGRGDAGLYFSHQF